MAYASTADFIVRFDARTIGDLVGDTDTRATGATLTDHDNLEAALDDASGEIEAALLVGERYSVAQLTALTGNSLAYLKRICCDIAMANLASRRVDSRWAERREGAEKVKDSHLAKLRSGEHVFNIAALADAGTPKVDGPTTSQITRMNFIVDRVPLFANFRPTPGGR